jgi:lysophospholipase L1-like esterase
MIKPAYIALGVGAAYAAFYLRKIRAKGDRVTIVGDSLSLLPGGWQDILAKKYGWTVNNISKVGQTSAAALSRFRLVADPGDIVFIFLGANDSYGGVNKAFTLDNIRTIQQLAKDRGARTVIIPGYLSSRVTNSTNGKRYDDLKESMYWLPGIVVPLLRSIDVADVPDGVHLTAKGQAELAKLIDAWSLR